MTANAMFEKNVFHYVKGMVSRGEFAELEKKGLSMEVIAVINQIDLDYVDESKAIDVVKQIVIDRAELDRLCGETNAVKQREKIIDALIKAGATGKFFEDFFGINRAEVANRRKLLGLATKNGRHAREKLTERQKAHIAQIVEDMASNMASEVACSSIIQCQVLLKTANLTEHSVTAIWKIIREFEAKGLFNWASE